VSVSMHICLCVYPCPYVCVCLCVPAQALFSDLALSIPSPPRPPLFPRALSLAPSLSLSHSHSRAHAHTRALSRCIPSSAPLVCISDLSPAVLIFFMGLGLQRVLRTVETEA
jgi:hypothetical protein